MDGQTDGKKSLESTYDVVSTAKELHQRHTAHVARTDGSCIVHGGRYG